MRLFNQRDFRTQPWKNGQGTTVELYRLPHPQDPERFLLRLSEANVGASGPFSTFEGIQRHLVLLSGNGMRLSFNSERALELKEPFETIAFSGDEKIDCQLIDGPTVDFNVMVDPRWGTADVKVHRMRPGERQKLPCAKPTFVYQIEDRILRRAEHEVIDLEFEQGKTLIVIVIDEAILKDIQVKTITRGHTAEFFELVNRNRFYLKQWLGWLDGMTTVEQADRYLETSCMDIAEERLYRAWIWYKGKIVGIVHLAEVDWKKRRAMVGYWVGQEYSGKGLATHGAAAVIDFAFREWQLKEIEIRCATGNIGSQRVAMKLGFQRTGHVQNNEWLYDRYVDHIVFTKRAEDWA